MSYPLHVRQLTKMLTIDLLFRIVGSKKFDSGHPIYKRRTAPFKVKKLYKIITISTQLRKQFHISLFIVSIFSLILP